MATKWDEAIEKLTACAEVAEIECEQFGRGMQAVLCFAKLATQEMQRAEADAERLAEALTGIKAAFEAHLFDEGKLEYPDTCPQGGHWDSIREANTALAAHDAAAAGDSGGSND